MLDEFEEGYNSALYDVIHILRQSINEYNLKHHSDYCDSVQSFIDDVQDLIIEG